MTSEKTSENYVPWKGKLEKGKIEEIYKLVGGKSKSRNIEDILHTGGKIISALLELGEVNIHYYITRLFFFPRHMNIEGDRETTNENKETKTTSFGIYVYRDRVGWMIEGEDRRTIRDAIMRAINREGRNVQSSRENY